MGDNSSVGLVHAHHNGCSACARVPPVCTDRYQDACSKYVVYLCMGVQLL